MPFEIETPLLLAAMAGHAICIEALLKAGADPCKGTHLVYTPLGAACNRSLNCVKLLVKDSDVNCQTAMKETSLHVAARYGKAEIVAYHIEKNDDLELTDANGQTLLFVAAQFGKSHCLMLLLARAKSDGVVFLKKYIHITAYEGPHLCTLLHERGLLIDCKRCWTTEQILTCRS
ncbi:hypothetical protein DPMN_140791 [Dreissena polymorpha]|uniref:Uncharacterized protein n=1 Tax=Dreissena polymorpha TaxID=45954 RepID=A0A9D4JH02_DREPO|nr:hypothetical protein DPMN_140791 [Dreissena polymorpha]